MNMPKDTKGTAPDNAEGRGRWDTSDQDVEGHGFRGYSTSEQDVEGHGLQRPRPSDGEDDVEGHGRY